MPYKIKQNEIPSLNYNPIAVGDTKVLMGVMDTGIITIGEDVRVCLWPEVIELIQAATLKEPEPQPEPKPKPREVKPPK